ncbi:nucleoplasmin-like protein [Stomoxys calcitrans]|uniref:Nucleoplasmin core domain-containing protein n=1 Tax=Stomoxys calcitrans TaxID=35570 RepID=A0A1I8P5Z5_STOCA|nr:nucleoplasmin-like protein [Stomoxys calcitrans]
METESFYGVELSEKDPLAQFEVAESDKEVQDQKLIIKQISLGADAKQGEFNVVQAEVKVDEKQTLKIPIAVLKVGETRVLKPNLEFPSDSVTFKLTQGTGPVYICGQHLVHELVDEWGNEDEEDVDDDDEDEDGEAPPPQQNGKNSKKK